MHNTLDQETGEEMILDMYITQKNSMKRTWEALHELGSINRSDCAENKEKVSYQWLVLAFFKRENHELSEFAGIFNQAANVSVDQIPSSEEEVQPAVTLLGSLEAYSQMQFGAQAIIATFAIGQRKLSLLKAGQGPWFLVLSQH